MPNIYDELALSIAPPLELPAVLLDLGFLKRQPRPSVIIGGPSGKMSFRDQWILT